MLEIHTTQIVVSYGIIFDSNPLNEEERIQIIRSIPKMELIGQLAIINLHLKGPLDSGFQCSEEFQIQELERVCRSHDQLFNYCIRRLVDYKTNSIHTIPYILTIFNRPANLFAMAEIIKYGQDFEIPPNIWTRDNIENFLKYYLTVNDIVSKYNATDTKAKYHQWENLSAGNLFLNDLNVAVDPIFSFQRFVELIKYFRNDSELKTHIDTYFSKVGITPEQYLNIILNIYAIDASRTSMFYYHQVPENMPIPIRLFDFFSLRNLAEPTHELDVVEIKKSPFYKIGERRYILMDSTFLLEKCYEALINELWFETVKPSMVNIKRYRGWIGIFFELHVSKILKRAFSFLPLSQVKVGSELLVDSGQLELSDAYIREGAKVLLGEIKSSGIYALQYQGNAEALLKGNPDQFYKDYGLEQLINHIKNLRDKPLDFDISFPVHERVTVYPTIIQNEKTFKTAPIVQLFSLKFQERIIEESLGQYFDIKPLTLIHISDLERVENVISSREIAIWDLIDKNYMGAMFPRPFFVTLNRLKIKPEYPIEFGTFAGVINAETAST